MTFPFCPPCFVQAIVRCLRSSGWLVVALAPAAFGAVSVVVNTSDTAQTIDGFGASIVAYDLLPEYQEPGFYDRAVFDLGLSILRVPLGRIEEVASESEDPAEYAQDVLTHGTMAQAMEMARQFRARGVKHILATPWTAPPWMKTNRSAIMGGRLRPDLRGKYGEFLSAFVQGARERYDVVIDSVSLQNELLFVEPYASTVYNPLQLRETLRAVQARFTADGLSTELVLPEEMGFAGRFALYLQPLMADRETRSFRGFFASHGGNGFRNWRRIAAETARFERKLWMTETSGHNPGWQGAMALAENMHDTLAGGNASAFIYWQLSEPNPGRMALLAAGDTMPKSYAVKHFARFIRPGAQRVYAGGPTAGVLVSAYKHPVSGYMTVVLINHQEEPATVDLQLVEANPPLKWLTFTSQEGSYFQFADTVETRALNIPGRGIVTLYGRCGESLAELPSLVPKGWASPALGASLAKNSTGAPDERLHAAARANDVERVGKLFAEGVDPNGLNVAKLSALHRAAWPGHVEVVRPLVEGGADPNVRDGAGGSPLLIAAGRGRDAFIDAMVAMGADVNVSDRRGLVAIHRAALGGHADTVRLLLRLGANPNLADRHGWTALHWAAASPERSSLEVLRILVKGGAGAASADQEGLTPLHVAAANLVDPGLFHRQRQAESLLYLNAQRMRVLVAAGGDVNARDAGQRTPLHWAAWLGETMHGEDVAQHPFFEYRTEAIRYLLAAGADPAAKDASGRVPADYAQAEGYMEAASLLKHAAALPWLAGRSPDLAASALEFGPQEETPAADPANPPRSGRLLRAASTGNIADVRSLLSAGANPNAGNPRNGIPLHAAVIGGHLPVVQALLQAGADVRQRDSDGYTALDRAMQNNQTGIAAVLRAAGEHAAPPSIAPIQ